MMKTFPRLIALTTIVVLLLTANVHAFDAKTACTNSDLLKTARLFAKNYISIQFDGFKMLHKIAKSDLSNFKNDLMNRGYLSSEANNIILLALGYDAEDLCSIGQGEIDIVTSEASEIVTSESYVKVSSDGTILEMPKSLCLEEVSSYSSKKAATQFDQTVENTLAVSINNNGYNDESIGGWMRIITSASYISDGWYYISGTYRWLSMPYYRMIDAMSLFASYCAWSQNNSDYYSVFTHKYYNYFGVSRTVIESKTTQDRVLNQEGVYYKWDLPPDTFDYANGNVYSVYYMNFYVRGKCRVSNYSNPIAFNVFTRYEHTYSFINIQPSFTWRTGSWPGVGINFNLAAGSEPYYSLCYVDYSPD